LVALRAGCAFDRCYHPRGAERQAVGIAATGCFEPLLGRVRAPALIVHGALDPLVSVEAGRASARAIRGARLEILPRMGHFLHEPLFAQLLGWIGDITRQGR
jgi:pimeloyl-ACP methyl ester carboxylesterase